MSFNGGWEAEGENWIAWARRPRDAYWVYRDAFFELVLAPGAATLEAGCGEGRVTRELTSPGHRVVATDASTTLIRAAQTADPAGTELRARPEPGSTDPPTAPPPAPRGVTFRPAEGGPFSLGADSRSWQRDHAIGVRMGAVVEDVRWVPGESWPCAVQVQRVEG